MYKQSTEDFKVLKILLGNICWIHAIIHLSRSIEGTTPVVNPKVSCGFGVIMMYQRGFINSSKRIGVVGNADNGEVMDVWRQGSICSLYVPLNFVINLKLHLKNEPLKLKQTTKTHVRVEWQSIHNRKKKKIHSSDKLQKSKCKSDLKNKVTSTILMGV